VTWGVVGSIEHLYDYVMAVIGRLTGADRGSFEADPEAMIAEISGHLNVQNSRLVQVMADVLANDEWVGSGVHTPAQWLAWRAGLSPERARVIVQVAERREAFPLVSGAFDRGELTLEQVAVIVTGAPAWAGGKVLGFAAAATVSQLRRTMTDRFFDDGPAPEREGRDQRRVNRVSFGASGDDRWRITGNLDLTTGRRIEAALAEKRDALFERGETEANWADALVDVAETSLDAVESESRRDRYRTWLHVDVTNGSATTTDGWRIPMAVRDRLLCDGVVQPVWVSDGVPFSVGRSQRIVPQRTRRMIERRDRGCRVPGCTATSWVEIHHIVHWLQGGRTDTGNLISLCGKHHRQHHAGELGVTGDADEADEADEAVTVVFTDARGRVIAGCGRPCVPMDDPDPPRSPSTPQTVVGSTTDGSTVGSRIANWNDGVPRAERTAEPTHRPDVRNVVVPGEGRHSCQFFAEDRCSMPMYTPDDARLSFDEAAETHDQIRPSYPPELFDTLFERRRLRGARHRTGEY
jgi:hypothetical protein